MPLSDAQLFSALVLALVPAVLATLLGSALANS
ncbi:photosystem I reaction center subunit XII [Pseudanabaena yagii]|jgi:photosystem I reaction center subunit XII|uniref:Photosystem I reaction center subunit XII n=1 Tax=Pseudanabaena yagii GIHE-NHR1 TaxID=2722753 RepID=A0ABX1LXQ6_9CYAN|nr:photosystem I reaction center subunit XII [Pseudanabaena yagii]NMF58647.1 photosystem I reaction center subunit XII [Pseudanabaena yagii GIHE-NHR1]